MLRHKRDYPIGQDHPNAKLTNRDVELIISLNQSGMSPKELAKKMECSLRHIYYVIKGERRGC